MRKLLLLLWVGFLVSCSNEQPKDPKTAIFIADQVRDFITYNPDWIKDQVEIAAVTDKFKHKVINLSNETDFLKNMPLQLKAINDTLINEETYQIAKFKAADHIQSTDSLLKHLTLNIDGIVSVEQVKQLEIGKIYTLTGTLYRQGKRADIKFIPKGGFYTYDLGKYTFTITSFKNYRSL